MRLGIVPKFLIPLSLIFACLTFVVKDVIEQIFAFEQISIMKSQAIGAAGQTAMMFDSSASNDNLKRVVTLIALEDSVTRAVIADGTDNKVLASSYYIYANFEVNDLEPIMVEAYNAARASELWHFTPIEDGKFVLAYPVITISENNTDTLEFILLISFDTFIVDQQIATFERHMTWVAIGFFCGLFALTYFLMVILIKKPLERFENAIKNQTQTEDFKMLEFKTNDEFGDIAQEFNRMQSVELSSLKAAKAAKNAAESLAKKKTQFLANMSHELRTPINGIMGLTQLCLQSQSTQEQNRYLTRLMESSNLLLTVVNDILDFSKLNQNAMSIAPENTVVASAVEPIAHLIQVMANKKGLDFKVVISNNVPYKAMLDPQRVQQILLNILNNAIKFTDKGRVLLHLDFAYKENDSKDHEHNEGILKLIITDTGIGMSAPQLANLFTPFEQADSSISRHYGGTGLGLSICDQLVKLMNGNIDVSSTPSKGSMFKVEIPCDSISLEGFLKQQRPELLPTIIIPDGVNNRTQFVCDAINHISNSNVKMDLLSLEDDWSKKPYILNEGLLFKHIFGLMSQQSMHTSQSEASIFAKQADSGTSHRILLVEDNEINAIVIENMLLGLGYEVTLAENGEVAINKHKTGKFDAIVMDIQMPVMDGITATKQIRQSDTDILIIGLSANVLDEDKQKALNAGMQEYLHKPILLAVLAAALSRLLV